jgi:hypothetical protein
MVRLLINTPIQEILTKFQTLSKDAVKSNNQEKFPDYSCECEPLEFDNYRKLYFFSAEGNQNYIDEIKKIYKERNLFFKISPTQTGILSEVPFSAVELPSAKDFDNNTLATFKNRQILEYECINIINSFCNKSDDNIKAYLCHELKIKNCTDEQIAILLFKRKRNYQREDNTDTKDGDTTLGTKTTNLNNLRKKSKIYKCCISNNINLDLIKCLKR